MKSKFSSSEQDDEFIIEPDRWVISTYNNVSGIKGKMHGHSVLMVEGIEQDEESKGEDNYFFYGRYDIFPVANEIDNSLCASFRNRTGMIKVIHTYEYGIKCQNGDFYRNENGCFVFSERTVRKAHELERKLYYGVADEEGEALAFLKKSAKQSPELDSTLKKNRDECIQIFMTKGCQINSKDANAAQKELIDYARAREISLAIWDVDNQDTHQLKIIARTSLNSAEHFIHLMRRVTSQQVKFFPLEKTTVETVLTAKFEESYINKDFTKNNDGSKRTSSSWRRTQELTQTMLDAVYIDKSKVEDYNTEQEEFDELEAQDLPVQEAQHPGIPYQQYGKGHLLTDESKGHNCASWVIEMLAKANIKPDVVKPKPELLANSNSRSPLHMLYKPGNVAVLASIVAIGAALFSKPRLR